MVEFLFTFIYIILTINETWWIIKKRSRVAYYYHYIIYFFGMQTLGDKFSKFKNPAVSCPGIH